MAEKTITEALAELKIVGKKLDNQRTAAAEYLFRPENQKDPLEKQGGSVAFVAEKRQSVRDLESRFIAIRYAIATANQSNQITIEGETMTIANWLVWKREVYPQRSAFLRALLNGIGQARRIAAKQQGSVTSDESKAKPGDIVVNLDEKALTDEIEKLDTIFGTLDGQLSLKNATLVVNV